MWKILNYSLYGLFISLNVYAKEDYKPIVGPVSEALYKQAYIPQFIELQKQKLSSFEKNSIAALTYLYDTYKRKQINIKYKLTSDINNKIWIKQNETGISFTINF